MIGNRLKLARSAAGLSLRALEGRIGGRVTAQSDRQVRTQRVDARVRRAHRACQGPGGIR